MSVIFRPPWGGVCAPEHEATESLFVILFPEYLCAETANCPVPTNVKVSLHFIFCLIPEVSPLCFLSPP